MVWADPLTVGAGNMVGAIWTSADHHPGVSDSIEQSNGRRIIQASDEQGALGEKRNAVPEYGRQCEKRSPNGRVASDGDR